MSIAKVPELVWPPYQGEHPTNAQVASDAPTMVLRAPVAGMPRVEAFTPPAPEPTDHIPQGGLGARLAAVKDGILAEQNNSASMTWGVLNGRSGDTGNWERLNHTPSVIVNQPPATGGLQRRQPVPRQRPAPQPRLDEHEITAIEKALANYRQQQEVPTPQPATSAEAPRRQGLLEKIGLYSASLFMNRMVQLTIGGRGRHSAPGRNI